MIPNYGDEDDADAASGGDRGWLNGQEVFSLGGHSPRNSPLRVKTLCVVLCTISMTMASKQMA